MKKQTLLLLAFASLACFEAQAGGARRQKGTPRENPTTGSGPVVRDVTVDPTGPVQIHERRGGGAAAAAEGFGASMSPKDAAMRAAMESPASAADACMKVAATITGDVDHRKARIIYDYLMGQ